MDKAIFETAHLAALNDQQRAAVEAVNGPVLLLAVPGSGKTTVLITRLGYMTEVCGIAPEAILTRPTPSPPRRRCAPGRGAVRRRIGRTAGVPHYQRCGGAHHRAVQPHVWPYPAGAHPQ